MSQLSETKCHTPKLLHFDGIQTALINCLDIINKVSIITNEPKANEE